MKELQDNYAGRADFEALCDKTKEMGKNHRDTMELQRVMQDMYALLYCLDDLSNGANTDRKGSQYANAGQMLINCLDYMRNILADNLQE